MEPSDSSHEEQLARIKEICEPFYLSNEELTIVKTSLLSEIQKGLKADGHKKSSVKCWPTFVDEYPSGCEHGKFLALEIRDHNVHIMFICLKGSQNFSYEKETHEIPTELKTGNSDDFFKYLADKLKKFLTQLDLKREDLSMALCLSYPLEHISLKSAILQNFNKNLNIKNIEGQDVVPLLQEAINQIKGFRINVETVLSNCTAILLGNSWQDCHCHIGVNIGLGFNAAYMESVSEIETLLTETSSHNMIINTEWGNFGANGHLDNICTIYDEQTDKETKKPGEQKFEKLVSGLYLGEVARRVFVQCINEKVLFDGNISNTLNTPFSYTMRHFIKMLEEENDSMRLLFDKLGISQPSEKECAKVRYILESLANRAAQLTACGITSVAEKIAASHIVIGMGGTLCFHIPNFITLVETQLKNLFGSERTFEIKTLRDGVAIGSALSAAISKSKEYVYCSEETVELLENLRQK